MFLPIVFIIFSAQALAFHAKLPAKPKNCEDNTIIPEPVADLQQLIGEWYGLYFWFRIADKSNSNFLEQCPKLQVAKATQEDIEEQKAICQHISQEDFDFDKVEIMAQIEEQKVMIAKGDKYHLTLIDCSYVLRVQFLKIRDDVFLINTPEACTQCSPMNLVARNVPSDEELSCIVSNIAALDGYIGFPFC